MLPSRRARVLLLCSGLLALAAAPADADPRYLEDSPDTEVARRHYDAGRRHYIAGRYDEAIAAFESALALRPLPALHYNVARCYERLAHWAEAISAYRAFLDGAPDAPEREEVMGRLAELQRRVDQVHARNERAAQRLAARRTWQAGAALLGLGGASLLGAGISFGVADASNDSLTQRFATAGVWNDSAAALETRAQEARTAGLALVGLGSVVLVAGVITTAVGATRARSVRAR